MEVSAWVRDVLSLQRQRAAHFHCTAQKHVHLLRAGAAAATDGRWARVHLRGRFERARMALSFALSVRRRERGVARALERGAIPG